MTTEPFVSGLCLARKTIATSHPVYQVKMCMSLKLPGKPLLTGICCGDAIPDITHHTVHDAWLSVRHRTMPPRSACMSVT